MFEELATHARRVLTVASRRSGEPVAPRRRRVALALVGIATALVGGCTDGAPLGLDASDVVASSRSAERCRNVEAEGAAQLGFVALPNGTVGGGATWFPVTLGGISGEMASVVVSQEMSGSRGALHLVLEHAFRTAGGDYFVTRDRAVCAPAGSDPSTCRVNDVLTIVGGTGIFANANGRLRNQGTIDFAAGTVGIAVRGRICGDGL